MSRKIFTALPCDDLLETGKFLAVDYRVSCLDNDYKIYRTYAYVAILIWPVGFPLVCFAMLWYYEVPQIAACKIKRAEEHAFLQHWTSKLAKLRKPPTGIDGLELHELTQLQLYHLLESVTSFRTASDVDAELELGIGSRKMFDEVFVRTDASSEQPLPTSQSPECSQPSTALPAKQAPATSMEETVVQVGTTPAPLKLRH